MNNQENREAYSDPKQLLKSRTYAFTLDLAFVLILNKAVTLSYTNFIRTIFYQLAPHTQQKILLSFEFVQFSTLWIVFWSYFVLSYYLGEGKTPGKMIFGIQTFSKKSNEGLSLSQSLVRTMGHFVCMISGLFLFALPYLRKDQKSLADLFAETWVSKESSSQNLELVPVVIEEQEHQDRAA